MEAALVIAPIMLFVLAANLALKIDAPDVRASPVAQRGERNAELSKPTLVRDCCFSVPAFIPIGVDIALVTDLNIEPSPQRVNPEHKCTAAIVVGIKPNRYCVVSIHAAITTQVHRHDLVRFAVITIERKIQGFVVI